MKKCFLFLAIATGVFVSCQSHTDAAESYRVANSFTGKDSLAIKADTLYDKLKNPWGMVWLPDGRMLVTELNGSILIFRNDKFTGEQLSGVPQVFNHGQGGLMDIKLHPNYSQNGWIYITYAKPIDAGAATSVMRFKLQGNSIIEKQEVFTAKPAIEADFHFGSRIVFDKDGYLYVSSGERGTQPKVQELDNDFGKIHRLFDDGRVPADNPFAGKGAAHASIWTLGHRNPQGMVYDAATNRIWAVEHGPKGGDELNLIERGKNYGWPKTSYGINYDGTVLTPYKEMEGVQKPVRYWVPSIGPCGMALVTSDKYPSWKGNLLIGALAFKHLARVKLSGTNYVGEEKLLQDLGRFRYVAQSPDGYIYAVTEGPGLLIKLLPRKV